MLCRVGRSQRQRSRNFSCDAEPHAVLAVAGPIPAGRAAMRRSRGLLVVGPGAAAPDPRRGVADHEDGVFVVDPHPLTPSPFWRGGTSALITVIDPAIVDPLPGVAVHVEQPVLVGLFRADRPDMQ